MIENWKKKYSWSRSKQKMFETCEREYYYRYVKYYEVDQGDSLKKILYMIKNMHNSRYLLGDIVHKAIKLQYDQISRGRDESLNSALNYIARYINDIKANPKKFIIEAMNGKEFSDNELSEIGKESERQVKIFFNEFFDFYKNLEIIKHEEFCELIIDNYKFLLKPDLITKSKTGIVHITDWKTESSYSKGVDIDQMNLYILWVLEKKIADLEHLRAEVIFLDIGESSDYKVTKQDLEVFKTDLINKYKKLFEAVEEKYEKNDFIKCNDEKNCISCGFKGYCEVH